MARIGPDTEEQAATFQYNPFDLTKVWPHAQYPLLEVAELALNRNPANYFADVEQSAFEPSNVPPGMGFSPDKMLQARLLAYPDAHRYRLGVNYAALPVNRPHACPAHTYHRDGTLRFDDNGGHGPNYEPNSFGGPVENPAHCEPKFMISGEVRRHDHRQGNDDYTQAGDLFRLMTPAAKARLIDNIVNSMRSVPRRIQEKQIQHFLEADPAYGGGVAEGLGLKLAEAAAG